jgi:ribosome-associated toxin RatA of RatAB toxin-antitoxin module
MPRVDVSIDICAPVDDVWNAVADVLSYPKFMPSVNRVEHLGHDSDGSMLTSWSVSLKGSNLEWTERDIADHSSRRLSFVQLDGDLDQFEGVWSVTEGEAGYVTIRLVCDFDIGIPLLAEMLNPVAARALSENCETMLRQIELQMAA